ncbi:MAG: nucleotide exchange factor GrpE [Candidatus Omnitrophica bacterium]|nr:nucleotide exchange factor GrpE [Candidatus Omnitrophota bacterium]
MGPKDGSDTTPAEEKKEPKGGESSSAGELNEKAKDKTQPASQEAETEKRPEILEIPRVEYENQLARLKELEALKDKLLLAAADFDNAKKRLAKERDEFVKFANEGLMISLIPVLDNFERALAHARYEGEDKTETCAQSILTGIQMVYKQLFEVLKNQGLSRMRSVGEIFDPHRHEAVEYVRERGKLDEIVEEVLPGYLLHDRLLRPARVKVRVAPDTPAGSQDSLSKGKSPDKEDEIT